MALVFLPRVSLDKDDKKSIQNLYDAYNKMRKEMEFLLENLDEDNVDSRFIKKLIADYIKADLVVTNTIITQNLYADLGDIARLTVNRLLSSNILTDPQVMNYIDIKDQYIVFKKGVRDETKPKTQYTNENGDLLYWTINKTSGEQEITTEVTENPVMAYQYKTSERLKIFFDENTATSYPKIVWGEGNGTGDEQKAFMYKDDTGMSIDYITSSNETLSIKLGENGILINGSPYHKITYGTGEPPVDGKEGDIYFKVVG